MSDMLQIGQTVLGRYRVEDLIFQGGQCTVGKAVDEQTGVVIAIRQLLNSGSSQEVARFERAANLVIPHPSIVNPIDYGEEGGDHYMIMPYVQGATLTRYVLLRGGPLPEAEAVSITSQVADALGAVHAAGIVHRDIKPDNILIDKTGVAHLIDFGICHVCVEQTISSGDGFLGSVQWCSPEQVSDPRHVDLRSDFYSLGAVLYYCLTATAVVEGHDLEELKRDVLSVTPRRPIELNPAVSPNLDRVCMRLLEKDPDRRPRSAGEVVTLLQGRGPAGVKTGQAFCTSCGVSLTVGANFCAGCGSRSEPSGIPQCLACGGAAGEGAACESCGLQFTQARHQIEFHQGLLAGTTLRIPEGIFEIGRDQLCPQDQFISRRQLAFACVNGTIFVQERSNHGTTVVSGSVPVTPVQVSPGAEITIAGNVGIYSTA